MMVLSILFDPVLYLGKNAIRDPQFNKLFVLDDFASLKVEKFVSALKISSRSKIDA